MPPEERPETGSAADWLRHAQSDLRAGVLLGADPHVMREQACFHFQQAAEKALKAVFVWRGIDFPRTHDLAQLVTLLVADGVVFPRTVRRVEVLTPYAVQSRYPADLPEISDDELTQAQAAATTAIAWAQKKVAPARPRKTTAKRTRSR